MVCQGLQPGTPAINYKLITTFFSTPKNAHTGFASYILSDQ